MLDMEWLLYMLSGNLELAERTLESKHRGDPRTLVNLAAIKFAQKKFEDVIRVTESAFQKPGKLPAEILRKIVEYRVLAAIALERPTEVIRALRLVRTNLLIFLTRHSLVVLLSSIYDLLSEQVLTLIRRLRHGGPSPRRIAPLSHIVCAAVYNAWRSGFFDALDEDILAEALAYASVLLIPISRTGDAKSCIMRALSIRDSYVTRTAAGKYFFIVGNLERSLKELTRAIELSADDELKGFEAKANIAQIYAMRGDYKVALEYVTDALKTLRDPIVRLIRGEILMQMGALDQAILAFRALLSSENREIRIDALLNLAVCLLEKNLTSKAFEYLWKAYMLDPSNSMISMLAQTVRGLIEKR